MLTAGNVVCRKRYVFWFIKTNVKFEVKFIDAHKTAT